MNDLAFRTLFSGGELFGVGARAAGWRHVDGYEFDPKIAAVANLNGFDVRTADVCDVDYETLRPVRHLHASPSCRNASQANTDGDESPEDIAAAQAVCRAIRAHAAQGGLSFTLENVWGYRNFRNCFPPILAALVESGFVYTFDHVNMADFGVPQTRKRLILRAVRREWRERVPGLRPTHGKRGGIMLRRWNGWFGAVADIIHEFPDTTPAPWQLKRLPKELRESAIVDCVARTGGEFTVRMADEPANTLRASQSRRPSNELHAYLLGGGNTNLFDPTSHARPADEPAFTLRDGRNGSPERALLLASNSNPDAWGGNSRWDDEPAQTTTGNADGRARALLIDGDNASRETGVPTMRAGDEPAMSIRAGRIPAHRGLVAGHWVRIPVRGLGRFQTVPDDYIGLTSQINGNGVPPEFARQLMTIFLKP